MRILDENFYNMLEADEIVVFSESQVESVMVQPIEIEVVEVETLKSAGVSHLNLVIVTLLDGRFLSTRPDLDAKKAIKIAEILSGYCERYHAAQSN